MCRSIERLFNIDPCVTEDEIHAAALQFVRKISGVNKPSKANEVAFLAAVDSIAEASSRLLSLLQASAPPLRRVDLAAKARERAAQRFPARRVTGEA
jgi:hypothetical protein